MKASDQNPSVSCLLSCRHNIYSSTMGGGVVTPPMLIVFHDKYTTLDPMWHIRHLGKTSRSRGHIKRERDERKYIVQLGPLNEGK